MREFDALAGRWQDQQEEARFVQDAHFASLLALTANLKRDPKKQAYKLEEFLLFGGAPARTPAPATPKPKQTIEDMKRQARALTVGMGGTIHEKEAAPDG